MKYLKSFNEASEMDNFTEIINNIKDICIELQHEGLIVNVNSPGETRVKTILIDINKNKKAFSFGELKDVIYRIIDYLNPYGFIFYHKSSVKYHGVFTKYKGLPDITALTSYTLLLQKK